jgi:hypothetical protein
MSISLIGAIVTQKINIETRDQVYFFDKTTGEKFAKLSGVLVNDIDHYHMKSVTSGKTVLLSEYGIQQRFSGTSDRRLQRIKDLVPRFLKPR